MGGKRESWGGEEDVKENASREEEENDGGRKVIRKGGGRWTKRWREVGRRSEIQRVERTEEKGDE